MHRVYREYERRKEAEGLIDFEDLLELAVRLFESDDAGARRRSARSTARSRSTSTRTSTCCSRRCSTCGSATRDDLCVVGDDYQSIYAFTGAAPEQLLGVAAALPARDRRPARGELPLDAAGARAREPARAEARRRREGAARRRCADGPEPVVRAFATAEAEGARDRRARSARSAGAARGDRDPLPHERAPDRLRGGCCTTRGIPFQGASLLERDAARRLLRRLERDGRRRRRRGACAPRRSTPAGSGSCPTSSASASSSRQTDLARLVSLAEELRRRARPSSSPSCGGASTRAATARAACIC